MALTQPQSDVQIGTTPNKENFYIEVIENGPYVIHGDPELVQQFIVPDKHGTSVIYQEGKKFASGGMELCRCGLSANKPFCDNSHNDALEAGVELTETATFEPGLPTAEAINGPVVSLTDDEKLCAFARFCDNGRRIWNEVQRAEEESIRLAVEMAHHCPSGRLIIWGSENQPIEDGKVAPVIGLIEDVVQECSGPIVLWGGIPVKSSNGSFYEIRNRQTLCRCGQSSNKPFCDGTHASMKFQDGLPKQPAPGGKVF